MSRFRKKKILLVEDDPAALRALRATLKNGDYEIRVACDGSSAVETGLRDSPDLALVDLGLPGLDGFRVCEELRDAFPLMPILIVSGRDSESDIVRAFESGADDYITKPFSPRELQARVAASLRRGEVIAAPLLEFQDFAFDREERVIRRGEASVPLTAREFEILDLLIARPGHAFARETLLVKTESRVAGESTRTIDNFVARLRSKIGAHHIETVREVGYRFVK